LLLAVTSFSFWLSGPGQVFRPFEIWAGVAWRLLNLYRLNLLMGAAMG
jgi:hypothetical protein